MPSDDDLLSVRSLVGQWLVRSADRYRCRSVVTPAKWRSFQLGVAASSGVAGQIRIHPRWRRSRQRIHPAV